MLKLNLWVVKIANIVFGCMCLERILLLYFQTMSNESEKGPIKEEEPGIIFVLYPPLKVHSSMALPSMASIRPRLQQGKKYY